jgi:hypothetical protein
MFRLRWEQKAFQELADCWNNASPADRRAITPAAHEAEQRLRRDPRHEGESRPGGRRIIFVPPLAVIYRVDGRLVSILGVRRYGRRP